MSTPINPLDHFQSYSYHHFLIAANNTEALRQIEDSTISFASLAGLKHGETVPSQKGSVVMVLNSVVDSKYFIDSINYSAVYVNVQDSTAMLTQTTELDMIVKETGGATFINFLREVSDVHLQTSYNSICWLLKTFFVGHRIDGTTEMFPTTPITLLLGNMDSQFDFSGGIHTIKFWGLTNGAPLKNENLHYVNRNLNLVTSDNSILLKDLVADLERKLNAQLIDHHNVVRKDANGNGRKVRYKFTLPKDWDSYKVKSTSKDNYVERLFEKEKQATTVETGATIQQARQNKPGIETDQFKTNMNTAVKTTVTQILSEIFKHCDEIHDAALKNSELGPDKLDAARLHQVVTSVTSDLEEIVVHFDIINYYLPRLPSDTEKAAITKVKEEELKGNADKNFDKYGITFDYIFTGMNSDILQMDMKANHTNILLIRNSAGVQAATGNMTATDKSVQAASDDQNIVKTENKKAEFTTPIRKYDAVYLPSTTADGQHGLIYAAPDSAQLRTRYVNFLASMAATSTSNMHIVIRGNPMFMNQQIRPLFPHNDKDYENKIDQLAAEAKLKAANPTGDYDPKEAVSATGKLSNYLPQFVRVNIMTPIFDTNGEITGYEKFWYQGRYRVTTIKNHFQQGSFTQEIFMLPYDLQELQT